MQTLGTLNIVTKANRIIADGCFDDGDLPNLLTAIENRLENGHNPVILDFSSCTKATSAPMLGLCARIIGLRGKGLKVELELPAEEREKRLFENTNWAHLIDPDRWPESSFHGHTQVPATPFVSPAEQKNAVNILVKAILESVTTLEREDFAALEWSLQEITDNVLVHAQAQSGGLVQLRTFGHKDGHTQAKYTVADAGIGIPATLRPTHPELRSDRDALEHSIREGVTRDLGTGDVGMGNGLFGSFEIARLSGGNFGVHSGNARLDYDSENGLHVDHATIPYPGTVVTATIDCSKPGVLAQALRFKGEIHHPVDSIETAYELDSIEAMRFIMKDESESFGSRAAGEPVRTKLANLASMGGNKKIYVDLCEIPLISSSFADEVFGKLVYELRLVGFMHRFEIINATDTVASLINRAIEQRLSLPRR